ncbi:MAG: hypothetical protein ACREMV_09870 [Gemmatimonadales bacterium]
MPDLTIVRGTCHALFAYEVGYAVHLAVAQRRLAAAERQTVKQRRRAPAYFEYQPAPLRVARDAEPVAAGGYRTAAGVELVLYDFGAISVRYAIPIAGPFADLPELSEDLWGNELLAADSRGHVERALRALGDAVVRPGVAPFVEDYAIFEIEAFTTPVDAATLSSEHAQIVARVLRAEARALSQQEVADATASRLSFGPNDATFIDGDATLLFDPEGDDVRDVIEFANTQLLEMRYLDAQLDRALDGAYELLSRRPRFGPRPSAADLRRLGRLQLDGAVLFEQVTNALKLIGDQYLTRVYGLVSRRFHLADWDASITRKLETLESIYSKTSDEAAARRMEVLEWIIIVLIAVSIVVTVWP